MEENFIHHLQFSNSLSVSVHGTLTNLGQPANLTCTLLKTGYHPIVIPVCLPNTLITVNGRCNLQEDDVEYES
jgi:hypothetical protein